MDRMEILDLEQHSPEWDAHRDTHDNASDAPAMMGDSKHVKRLDFVRMKATGQKREFSDYVQRMILDKGHKCEALARPIIDERLGDVLFPVTGRRVVEGLRLSASFDGLDMGHTTGWENKAWNEDLAAQILAADLEGHYYWQLEHQLLVSGAKRVYFTTSDGTEERTVGMFYESIPERRAMLIRGWHQFHADVKNYVHVEPARELVAAPVKELPTLLVRARGEIIESNLPAFKAEVTQYLATLETYKHPATDQEFVDGKAIAKNLREAAKRLTDRKADVLAQTASLGEVMREIDALAALLNTDALAIEKAVEAEEKNRKQLIAVRAQQELNAHIDALNTTLGGVWVPQTQGDWAGAIKGKRLISSMEAGVHEELAKKKLEATALADRLDANHKTAGEWMHLLPDFATVGAHPADVFGAILAQRIEAARKPAEAAKPAEAPADTTNVVPLRSPAQPAPVEAPASGDDATIDEFLALLPDPPAVKVALRQVLQRFVKYQHARGMVQGATA